nr:MAG TPA: hypothetical protein [Herelleviridae sp.]
MFVFGFFSQQHDVMFKNLQEQKYNFLLLG